MPLKWTKGEFVAVCRKGSRTRTGWVSDRWAIEKGYQPIPISRDDPYRITHLESGYAVGLDFRTLAEAKLAAERFDACGDPRHPDVKPKAGALYQAMRRYPLHRSHWKGIPMGRDFADPHAAMD